MQKVNNLVDNSLIEDLLKKRYVYIKNRDGIVLKFNINKLEENIIKEAFKDNVFIDAK